MSLIAMVCHLTDTNDRVKFADKALENLFNTVDGDKHRVFIVANGCGKEGVALMDKFKRANELLPQNWTFLESKENIGTAEAINLAWSQRRPGEHCIKIDDDIIVHAGDWVEQLEEVVTIDPTIGQCGLKRKDCSEHVNNENPFYRSKIRQLPHVTGNRWIIVEQQFHVMGSCVLHTSELLDRVGLLYQVGLYGFDDSFMSARCIKAGLMPVMLPHIVIDHIDDGTNPYQKHKEKLANDVWAAGQYVTTLGKIHSGVIHYKDLKNVQ